jgi:hypothetical protein
LATLSFLSSSPMRADKKFRALSNFLDGSLSSSPLLSSLTESILRNRFGQILWAKLYLITHI